MDTLARRICCFILCLFLLLPLVACGGDTPVAVENQPAVLPTGVNVEEIIEFLTASEMRGRLVGTPENARAVEFIDYMFWSLGLTPFDGQPPAPGSFLHAYRQEVFDIELADPRLTVTLAGGTERALQLGSEFHIRMGPEQLDARLTPVSEIHGLDIEGREGRIYTPGEAGPMTIFASSQWPLPVRWTFFPLETPMVGAPRSFLIEDDGTLYSPLDSTRGRGAGSDFSTTAIGIDAALYEELMEIGIEEVRLQSGDGWRAETVHNVIGLLEGRDRSRAVVISAHLDGTGFIGDVYTQGAIDNASGLAAILYAAAILENHRDELEIDVIFAAFNGEEVGLLGSFAFAPLAAERYETLYNLNIDCVGVIDWEDYSLCAPSGTNDALRAAFLEKMNLHGFALNPLPYGWSDHIPFERLGFPAISFGQLDERIHTPEDRAEFLNIAEIQQVGRLVADFVLSSGAETFGEADFGLGLYIGDDEAVVYAQVRSALEQIGGLAYDEAYQFILADGRHVMLTGARPLVNLTEVETYYPDLILPEQVGDFQFQYFFSFNLVGDVTLGTTGPFRQTAMWENEQGIVFEAEEADAVYLPLREVFTREILCFGFAALYENPLGEQVRLFVGRGSHRAFCETCTIYGNLHFPYLEGLGYAQAIYPSESGIIVKLDLIDGNNPDYVMGDVFTYRFLYVEFDELLAIAVPFDLPNIIERYQWQLTPLQDVLDAFWVSTCPDWI